MRWDVRGYRPGERTAARNFTADTNDERDAAAERIRAELGDGATVHALLTKKYGAWSPGRYAAAFKAGGIIEWARGAVSPYDAVAGAPRG